MQEYINEREMPIDEHPALCAQPAVEFHQRHIETIQSSASDSVVYTEAVDEAESIVPEYFSAEDLVSGGFLVEDIHFVEEIFVPDDTWFEHQEIVQMFSTLNLNEDAIFLDQGAL